jgi:DNA-binding winged helix-turn-helix (wHTH) protein
LNAEERLLLREGEVVPLAPKAIDLLVALVENSGHVIGKDELMKRVWQDSFVEEANLSHHIFTLRKALGEDRNGAKFIETNPRRGYRFVASVSEWRDEAADIVVAEHSRARLIIEENRTSDTARGCWQILSLYIAQNRFSPNAEMRC